MNKFGGLEITTPNDREIVMTRVFDAPRALVYDCWTKPELVKRWLTGPDGWSFKVCDIDLRVGGAYRFVWKNLDGVEMGMGGVYREIVKPERIVNTQLFDQDWTGGETIGTLLLTERNGKTTSTNTVLYPSKEVRDEVLKSGMEEGVAAGYDRLEAMLPGLATNADSTSDVATQFTATLSVKNWDRAIEFYQSAFGAVVVYSVPGGGVARLSVSGAEFWVAEESPANLNFSPESLGGCSVRLLLIVPDPAATCKQGVAAGATQVTAVAKAHGWLIGRIVDPSGHHWEIARQLT